MRPRLERSVGLHFFGSVAETYDAVRAGHPDEVYDVLREHCGIGDGSAILEIGPGTGQATRRLLELGGARLVAIEPDPALVEFLRVAVGERVEIRATTLDDADLESGEYDLAAAASAFHWVEEAPGLAKLHGAVRPGGWVALWWTSYGDELAPDRFSRALDPLFDGIPHGLSGPSEGRPPFARDSERRLAALARAGFESVRHDEIRWTHAWDAQGIRGLYSTFSPISVLEPAQRETFLDAVARIARDEFGGRVERALVTSLYVARRPG